MMEIFAPRSIIRFSSTSPIKIVQDLKPSFAEWSDFRVNTGYFLLFFLALNWCDVFHCGILHWASLAAQFWLCMLCDDEPQFVHCFAEKPFMFAKARIYFLSMTGQVFIRPAELLVAGLVAAVCVPCVSLSWLALRVSLLSLVRENPFPLGVASCLGDCQIYIRRRVLLMMPKIGWLIHQAVGHAVRIDIVAS